MNDNSTDTDSKLKRSKRRKLNNKYKHKNKEGHNPKFIKSKSKPKHDNLKNYIPPDDSPDWDDLELRDDWVSREEEDALEYAYDNNLLS